MGVASGLGCDMVRKNRTKCQLEVGFKRNRSVLHSRASLARTFGKAFKFKGAIHGNDRYLVDVGGFLRHRPGHARRLRDQRDPPSEEVIPHWYDIHPIIVSPAVYAFAKQQGIFFAPCARRFIQVQ